MGCRTSECYANNLAEGKGGARRKGWPTKEGKAGGAMDTIGAKKEPLGDS
jgi:hypothetical protein